MVPFKMIPNSILLNIEKCPGHESKPGYASASKMQFTLGGGSLYELVTVTQLPLRNVYHTKISSTDMDIFKNYYKVLPP